MQSFEREDLQAPLSEINMTPLVDVMLVLLVIFLVTAPMLNNSIKLNLPTESVSQTIEEKTITISINNQGQYFIDEALVSESEMSQKLQSIAANNPKAQIHIRADVEVNYGKVSHVLAELQRDGLSNIGFVTKPK